MGRRVAQMRKGFFRWVSVYQWLVGPLVVAGAHRARRDGSYQKPPAAASRRTAAATAGRCPPPPGAGPLRTLARLWKTLAFPLVFGGSTRHEKDASAPAKWRDNALTKIEPGRFGSRLFMNPCCPLFALPVLVGRALRASRSHPLRTRRSASLPLESAPGGSRFRATMWEGNFREAPGHRPPPRPALQAVGLGVKP